MARVKSVSSSASPRRSQRQRVDTARQANYARLVAADGTVTERWINPPSELDRRVGVCPYDCENFYPMRADFRDAETLRPVSLGKDVSKQFWITVHTATNTPAGTYRGKVTLSAAPGDVLSRNYGGSADVFVTDVASGDRGASAEASKTRAVMRILADDWGVHFSFTDPDEQARAFPMRASASWLGRSCRSLGTRRTGSRCGAWTGFAANWRKTAVLRDNSTVNLIQSTNKGNNHEKNALCFPVPHRSCGIR